MCSAITPNSGNSERYQPIDLPNRTGAKSADITRVFVIAAGEDATSVFGNDWINLEKEIVTKNSFRFPF